MRLFKQVIYKLAKNETPAVLIDRVKFVLSELNCTDISSKLYLENHASGISYVQRAIKKFPVLQQFYSEKNYPEAISNLDSSWDVDEPCSSVEIISYDVIDEIARGIPKSYAFNHAVLIFDHIDWFGVGVVNTEPVITAKHPHPRRLGEYLSSSIVILSDWDSHGRENDLCVTLELITPDFNQRINPIDSKVQSLLESLGTIQSEEYKAALTQDEILLYNSSIIKANCLWNEYKNNLYDLICKNVPDCDFKKVELAHELEMKNSMETLRKDFESYKSEDSMKFEEKNIVTKSPMKVITKNFTKKGYEYKNIPGFAAIRKYVLVKQTSRNNRMNVLFDYWARGSEISCSLTYKSPYCEYNMDLPIAEDKGIRISYPIDSDSTLTTVVTNCLNIIEYLEKTVIKDLDDIYGEAPKWFDY